MVFDFADTAPLNANVAQLKQQQKLQRESNLSDDEPLYDAVASDDDYAALAPIGQQVKWGSRHKGFKNNSIG